MAAKGEGDVGVLAETSVGRFIVAYRARWMNNSKLAASTKARADDSVKTLIKT